MRDALQLARAEALTMVLGRRAAVSLAIAIVGSAIAGIVSGALLGEVGAGELEAAAVIVSRGSAAQFAIVIFASLSVAGPYRDGAWMHSALAVPSATRRLLCSAVPALLLALALAVVAAAAAIAGAAALVRPGLEALLVAVAVSLLVSMLWALWMVCLAHATRSPILVLAVGIGVPLLLEPGLAAAFVIADLESLRWLLPANALRAIAEGIVDDPVMLAPVEGDVMPIAIAAVSGWTLLAVAGAWARMRSGQPR